MQVNIGGDPADATYRYKRDRLVIEKISRTSAIYRISNIDKICKQLHAPDGFKLDFYKRIKKNGMPQVKTDTFKGMLTVADLENMLIKLIAQRILCPNCRLPEWDERSCRACGLVRQREASTDPDEVELERPQLHRAVVLYKTLYDRADDEQILKIREAFWRIEEADEVRHTQWSDAVERFIAQL